MDFFVLNSGQCRWTFCFWTAVSADGHFVFEQRSVQMDFFVFEQRTVQMESFFLLTASGADGPRRKFNKNCPSQFSFLSLSFVVHSYFVTTHIMYSILFCLCLATVHSGYGRGWWFILPGDPTGELLPVLSLPRTWRLPRTTHQWENPVFGR